MSQTTSNEMNLKNIPRITEEARDRIRRKSAYSLPLRPSEENIKPEVIKKCLYAFVTDKEDSVLGELDRVIDDINGRFVSYTGGVGAEVDADGAFSHGAYTRATRKYQAVFGTANAENDEALFIVGNGRLGEGDIPIERSNAFEVISDVEGNVYMKLGNTILRENTFGELTEAFAELPVALDSIISIQAGLIGGDI